MAIVCLSSLWANAQQTHIQVVFDFPALKVLPPQIGEVSLALKSHKARIKELERRKRQRYLGRDAYAVTVRQNFSFDPACLFACVLARLLVFLQLALQVLQMYVKLFLALLTLTASSSSSSLQRCLSNPSSGKPKRSNNEERQ